MTIFFFIGPVITIEYLSYILWFDADSGILDYYAQIELAIYISFFCYKGNSASVRVLDGIGQDIGYYLHDPYRITIQDRWKVITNLILKIKSVLPCP